MVHFLKRLHFLLFFAVVYCGPTEWRFERRRGSSVDRKNTIRHLIQMMAITEEELKDADTKSTENSEEDDEDGGTEFGGIPVEFLDLFNDEELKQTSHRRDARATKSKDGIMMAPLPRQAPQASANA